MTTAPALELAFAHGAELGEGLQWHAPSGRWWWTDIEGRCLHAWTPGAHEALTVRLPERVGCFVHARSGALLLGMAKRLAWLELVDPGATGTLSAQVRTVLPIEPEHATTRINDGRCDRSGNFVFGTLDEARPRQAIGRFYQYSQAAGLRVLALPPVAIANSICFSVDGRRMHFCDTLTRRILVCDYDAATARVSPARLFAEAGPDEGWPDGATVDRSDTLWSARWGAGCVLRYDRHGQRLGRHAVPVPQVSCPALGGPQGDELMVSTARQELDAAERARLPLSGSLFGTRPGDVQALPEVLFDDLGA